MSEGIGRKVRYVRSQISSMFTGNINEDVLMNVNMMPKTRCAKVKSMIDFPSPRTVRNKEQILLPSISIHRNPMSYASEREVLRCRPLLRRKTVSKGALIYKMALKKSTEVVDWDNVISTCSRLINKRQSLKY